MVCSLKGGYGGVVIGCRGQEAAAGSLWRGVSSFRRVRRWFKKERLRLERSFPLLFSKVQVFFWLKKKMRGRSL